MKVSAAQVSRFIAPPRKGGDACPAQAPDRAVLPTDTMRVVAAPATAAPPARPRSALAERVLTAALARAPMMALQSGVPAADPLAALEVGDRSRKQAEKLNGRIESLAATPAERGQIRSGVASLLAARDPYYDDTIVKLLDSLQGRPHAAQEFAYFQALQGTPPNTERAVTDLVLLQAAEKAHPSLPPEELVSHLQAFRAVDPRGGDDRPTDLGKPLDHVLAQSDAKARKAMAGAIVALQQKGRSAVQALAFEERLEKLGCPSDGIRAGLTDLLKASDPYYDESLLGMLDALRGRSDGAAGFQAFQGLRALVEGEQALRDLQDLQAAADGAGVPVAEMGQHAIALRTADPQRNGYNRRYCRLDEVLRLVARGPDPVARAGCRDELLALQQHARDAAQALHFESRLLSLSCPPEAAGRIRAGLIEILKSTDPYYDDPLVRLMDRLQGRAQAGDEFAAFQALHATGTDLERSESDLELVQKQCAQRPSLRLDEIVGDVVAFRKAEIQAGVDDHFANLEKPLEHILASPDATARAAMRDRLFGLELHGRNAERALQHEVRLEQLDGPPDEVRAPYCQLLKAVDPYYDDSLLGMLDVMAGRKDAAEGVKAYAALQALVGVESALGDLKASVAAADRHGVPLAEVDGYASALRTADPRWEGYEDRYRALDPVLDYVAAAPDAGARAQRCACLQALQQNGRDAAQTLPYAQFLDRLPDGEAIRPGLMELLQSNDPYYDSGLIGMLAPVRNAEDFAAARQLLTAAGGDAPRATADLKLVQGARVPLAEALGHLLALRAVDRGDRHGDLRAPLEHVEALPDADARARMRQSIVELAVGRRSAVKALEHETRLEALGGSAADAAAIRGAYVELLKTTDAGDDASLLQVLDDLKGRADSRAVFQSFSRLLALTKSLETAAADTRETLHRAAKHQVPVADAFQCAAAMREADPQRKTSYPRYGALGSALDYVLAAPDPCAAAKRLASLEVNGRSPGQALPLDQALPAGASDALVGAWRTLAAGRETYQDADSEALLKAVSGRPHDAEELAAANQLLTVEDNALPDLRLVQKEADAHSAIPLSEMAGYLSGMRAAERGRSDLQAPADLVLAPADAAERGVRAQAETRLLRSEQDGPAAAEDLQWILHDPTVGAVTAERIPTFDERVGRFVDLLRFANAGGRPGVKHLYDRIEADALVEHQGWFSRLFHRRKRMERLVYNLLKLDGNAGRAGTYLEAVEQGRFPDESLRSVFRRFEKFHKYFDRQTAESLRDAFVLVRTKPAWGGPEEPERWKQLYALTRQLESARDAGLIFAAMTGAATEAEAQNRRQAWFTLQSQVGDDTRMLYRAVSESLAPNQAMADEMAAILGLCQQQGADLAASTYAIYRKVRAQHPSEAGRVRTILGSAGTPEIQDALFARLDKPVAGEDFGFRASLLEELQRTLDPRRVIEAYDAAVKDLQPAGSFESLGPAYAALMSQLRGRDRCEVAEKTLQWLEEQRKADPDGPSVADMLMELNASLLVRADLDGAKSSLMHHVELLRKQRMGMGGIERKGDDVIVAGIKVKVRKTAG